MPPRFADFLEDGSPDPQFLGEAKKIFPTGTRAISALRRIGKPRIGSLNLSNPSKEIGTFLHILASLGTNTPHTTDTLIKENWTSLLAPWTFFILEELILSDGEPQTSAGWIAFDTALWTIPLLLDSPRSIKIRTLRDLTPRLSSIFARVWLKTVDQHHFTWGFWSTLLANLYRDDITANASFAGHDKIVFDVVQTSGIVLLRHIHREIPRIPTMSTRELSDLRAFLILLNPYGGPGPLYDGELSQSSLEALVHLLSTLLRKQPVSVGVGQGGGADSSFRFELSSVMILFEYIDSIMDGNIRVSEAVEAGLVVALLKAHPYYFTCTSPSTDTGSSKRFDVQAAMFLDRISQFLVFPSTLHHFLRSVKVITKSAGGKYETKLREGSVMMWNVWEGMKEKAVVLREIRGYLKSTGQFWKCNNDLCSGSGSSMPFLRCTGCLEAIYCSRSCRKVHWRTAHREECEQMRRRRDKGIPVATETDEQFFVGITARFIQTYRHELDVVIKNYAAVLRMGEFKTPSLSEEKRHIASGIKNPILVIDYVKAKAAQMSDCVILDSEELLGQFGGRLGRSRTLYIVETFRKKKLDIKTLFVIILLPMRKKESAGLAYEFFRQ